MRYKNIRGHKRRQRAISRWVERSSKLDVDALLLNNKYEYAEIYIQLWINITLTRSEYPEPKRKAKLKIIKGLETIYDSWKTVLEKLNQSYYLKIWLYEPRISKSQVVCAIGEKIEHYKKAFREGNISKNKPYHLNKLCADFTWEVAVDEDIYSESDLSFSMKMYKYNSSYFADRRFLKRLKKSNYWSETIGDNNGQRDILFFIPKGKIWIGERQ